MLVSFFDSMGIVKKNAGSCWTVSQYYYTEILETVKTVMRVRPIIKKNWILHHNNAAANAAPLYSAVSDTQMHYGDAAASLLTSSRTL
jgi:hypothetical protein